MILHDLKDSKWLSCSEASANLHYCGMAELAVSLNVSDSNQETPQFWGNHMKTPIPEMPSLCTLCSWDATDTQTDGVLQVFDNKEGGCLCVGKEDDYILDPLWWTQLSKI